MNIRVGFFAVLTVAFAAIPSRATTLPPSCGDARTIIDVTTSKHASVSPAPEPGRAKVIFIETADPNAAPVVTRIAIDGAWLGGNRGNSYFESVISPGEHHVCADWQLNRRMIKDDPHFEVFNAEPGHVYYFRVQVNWNEIYDPVVSDRAVDTHMNLSLIPLNEDEGQYLVLNSKLSTSMQKR